MRSSLFEEGDIIYNPQFIAGNAFAIVVRVDDRYHLDWSGDELDTDILWNNQHCRLATRAEITKARLNNHITADHYTQLIEHLENKDRVSG